VVSGIYMSPNNLWNFAWTMDYFYMVFASKILINTFFNRLFNNIFRAKRTVNEKVMYFFTHVRRNKW
jgi:hypothetical protein